MITQEQAGRLLGAKVYDRNHSKIGNVGQLYVNTATNRPEFASVNTGLFGMTSTLVPISEAELQGDEIVVPYDKDTVKDAPNIDAESDEPLSGAEIDSLYRHYGVADTDAVLRDVAMRDGFLRDDDLSGGDLPTTDPYAGRTMTGAAMIDDLAIDDDAMTRAEDRTGTGRARLRRYVAPDQPDLLDRDRTLPD